MCRRRNDPDRQHTPGQYARAGGTTWWIVALTLIVIAGPPVRLTPAQTTAETAGRTPEPNTPWFTRVPGLRSGFSLLRSLQFRRWEADVDFDYEWDRQDASVPQGPRTHFERMTYAERLRIGNQGFIVDPRLFSFGLNGTFGLFQETSSFDGQDQNSNGSLIGYSVNGILFPEKSYTLNAFANRSEDVLTREFAGTSKVRLENEGASLSIREIPVESVFAAQQESVREDLDFGPSSTRREESRTTASYHGTRLGEVSDLYLNYEFNDVSDKTPAPLTFTTQDASILYHRYFGPYLEKDFSSRLRAFDREGRFSALFGGADESLRIDHTDNLTTLHNYTFAYNKIESARTLTNTGSTGVQYKLYSLTTGLNGVANYSDFEGGHALGYGGLASLSYTKRIPFEGRIGLGVHGSYRIDNEKLPSGELFVSQEKHDVKDFELIPLANLRVVSGSIVVTTANGTPLEENFDYAVVSIGDLTELQRLPGGRLHDGDVIAVDYSFTTAPDLDFSTLAHGVNASIDYNWVSLYYLRQETDQHLLSGQGNVFLDDVKEQTAGAQLRWSRPLGQASALGEYRTYDSRRLAFDATRGLQAVSLFPLRTLTSTASVTESFMDFSNPAGRETLSILGRVDTTWRPRPYLFLEGFASYLRLDDNVAPSERVVDTGVRLQLDFGRVHLVTTTGFSRREVSGTNADEVRVTLSVLRKLL